MTDYRSQGKSRNPNVVHLNYSKNHMNYYVALSRGNEAEHTVIIQGFEADKITCGISGYLRQEFRELELLDEITTLRIEGRLHPEVSGMYRGQLLYSYLSFHKNRKEPLHFHLILKFDPNADNTDLEPIMYDECHPTNVETVNKVKCKASDEAIDP
jgi:hypothetical protein